MKRQHLWWKSFFLSGALTALTIWVVPVFGGAQVSTAEKPNPYVLATPANLLTRYPAVNPDGTINAVVEIPAGTTAKWQVSKRDGTLEWEFLNGKPRIVEYLPYPGNYGMIPRTLLPKERGGDGDPLDVIVLADAAPRGTVIKAKTVGVLKLLDGGEIDDKVICVRPDSPLGKARNLAELNDMFPGLRSSWRRGLSTTKAGIVRGPGVTPTWTQLNR